MNNIITKYILLTFFIVLLISCSSDKKSSTEPNLSNDQSLVGTWELTKITASIGGQTLVLTPEQAGLSTTAVFKSDGTFESTSTDSDGTSVDTGTWSTANGVLTLNINGEDPETSTYTINGNVATIVSSIPYSGVDIPATLEFTKK